MMKNEQLVLFQKTEEHEGRGGEIKRERAWIEKLAKKLQEERAQLVQKMKPELIEFCLAISEQILRQELAQPEVLAKKIHSLVDGLSIGQEPLTVFLSSEDLSVVENDKGKGNYLYYCSDPTLERGDIRIESTTHIVNCTLKREMATLRTHLIKGGEMI